MSASTVLYAKYADILRQALEASARQITEYAGVHGEVVVETIKTVDAGHGFDASRGDYGYLFAKGVVDAGKVTRSALPHAASIGAMAWTTEVPIADLREKNRSAVATGAGYGGDMDY